MNNPSTQWTKLRLGLIPVFFLSFFPGSHAQDLNTDPVSIALGGCYTTIPISAGVSNEAALGISDNPAIRLSHARPFAIKELGITSIAASFYLFPGNMQTGIMHYGIPGFQQINISMGYGMKLSEKLWAGIGFNYYNTSSLGEWSYLRTLGVSGGIILKPNEKTLLAAHIVNPLTLNNYPAYGSVFPALLSLGISREIYKSTKLFAELSCSSVSKYQVKIAAEYQYDRLIFRAGYHSGPQTLAFGSGFNFARTTMDIAFSYSMRTGVTPALAITYTPGR